MSGGKRGAFAERLHGRGFAGGADAKADELDEVIRADLFSAQVAGGGFSLRHATRLVRLVGLGIGNYYRR